MRLGLVLAGGTSKGAFEAGVLAAVEAAGLRPQVVAGTSAGALNAAGLAAGFDADRLADLWTSVESGDVYRLRRDAWRLLRPGGLLGGGNVAERVLATIGWTYLLETEPLRSTLVRILGGERVPVSSDLVVAVSAVELATGEHVRFVSAPPPPHRRTSRYRVVELTADHLMASAAIPLLFEPGRVDGAAFWDGALVASAPLSTVMAYEPDAVVVVTTATRDRPAPEPRTLGEAFSLLVDNLLAHSLKADLEHAATVNALCEAAGETLRRKHVDILVVEPAGLDLGDGLDFSPEQAARRIELGREVGARRLAEWDVLSRLTRGRRRGYHSQRPAPEL